MPETASISQTIKQWARDLGFALCGVAEARPTGHAEEVRAWLAAGRHGDMQWLANNLDARLDPDKLLPGARSVICVADEVAGVPSEPSPSEGEGRVRVQDEGRTDAGLELEDQTLTPTPPEVSLRGRGGQTGRIARYAQMDDYHNVLKKRLHRLADQLREMVPGAATRVCVDTAPVLEREHAMRSGLGWTGKNTLLIHPRKGSHFLLGEIITSLELEPDEPETDHCGTCRRCIDACPTQCITPYSVDAGRCLSYLNIEHRGTIAPDFHEAMGDWLYGCDICQDVCPYNSPRPRPRPRDVNESSSHAGYGEPRPASLPLLDVLNWTEDDRRAAFVRSAMKRAKLFQMKRNALIVAGNVLAQGPDAALSERIAAIAADENEHEVVRETARQVMGRVGIDAQVCPRDSR